MAVELSKLESLPAEIFDIIVESLRPNHDRVCRLLTDEDPFAFPLIRTNRAIRDAFLTSFTEYYVFSFSSRPQHSEWEYYAANSLLKWLTMLGPTGRLRIRKMRIEMTASELLRLFAPSHVLTMLRVPREPVWAQITKLLEEARLERIEIEILGWTCAPGPCCGSINRFPWDWPVNSRKCGAPPVFTDDADEPPFLPDHRWLVKSVLESPIFPKTATMRFCGWGQLIKEDEVLSIQALSWAMIESSCPAYHKCTIRNDNQRTRRKPWQPRKSVTVRCLIPTLVYDGTCRRGWVELVERVLSESCSLRE